MSVMLRSAVRTGADAAAFATGLEEASGGLFSSLFGARADRLLARVALVRGHGLSLEHVTVAELDGAAVGVLSGMRADQAGDPGRVLLRAAGGRSLRASLVTLAGWPLFTALGQHDSGDWHLQAVAVAPDWRGHGTGSQLLEQALRLATGSGAARLTLDVDVHNDRARALYERHGLSIRRTSRPASLLGGACVHRMSARL